MGGDWRSFEASNTIMTCYLAVFSWLTLLLTTLQVLASRMLNLEFSDFAGGYPWLIA